MPSRKRPADAKKRQLSIVRSISKSMIDTGLPTFSLSRLDSSSMFSSTTSATLCRISLRSRGVRADQSSNAPAAASTAASTSALSLEATSPMTAPVAGFTTLSVAPL